MNNLTDSDDLSELTEREDGQYREELDYALQ
jgi:hypothetical protein